ncbi:hypothetical protein WKQ99_10085 [Pseudomonas atacamensis]|uniref:hypothetical protein n=1 Tax=Pseudomonas atacamensis TaxID=2565368 RepID=UPI0030CC5264
MSSAGNIKHIARAVRNVVWQPTKSKTGGFSSQEVFLLLGQPENLVHEVLFHGTRGNGKSASLLMGFGQHVGKGWGPFWKGVILRRQCSALSDLIDESHKLFPRLFPGAKYNISKRIWTFPTGEVLIFEFLEKNNQYEKKFHGKQFTYIGLDELTTWATEDIYERLLSTLRTAYQPTKQQPLMPPKQIRATTNPWGVGKQWVKERFIDGKRSGQIERTTRTLLDVNKKPVEVSWSRVAIFGTVFENDYVDLEYKAWLMSLADPVLKEAWLYGNWEVVDDTAMFAKVWNRDVLLMEPFTIPAAWKVERSFDFGQSTPFCCLWTAEANGESVTVNGKTFCPPKGSIIVVGEDYGTPLNPDGSQQKRDLGLFLSAGKMGQRLKDREIRLQQTILRNHPVVRPGPADNQIFNGSRVDNGNAPTVAKELASAGITFVKSDKTAGSRVTSAQLMYERLQATIDDSPDKSHIYFFSNCKFLNKSIPTLYRDEDQPDSVKKGADDHAWDALAYRLTWKRPVTSIQQGIR